MVDWIINGGDTAPPQPSPAAAPPLTYSVPGPTPVVPAQPSPLAGLTPDLVPIVQRESGGKPFVGYTPPGQQPVDLSNAPLDETGFPIWGGNVDPSTGLRSHAAGILQIQPGTWRPIAKKLGITDFSLASQIAVGNELRKEQGLTPWDASKPKTGGNWIVTGAGNWNVSPKAIASAMDEPDTSVRYMSPDAYLALSPPVEEGGDRKRQSLSKSLEKGEQVENLPALDVRAQGNTLTVYDQDGRNRALEAKKAGVDLIPVAIHGVPRSNQDYTKITGMTGKDIPFTFAQVQAPEKTGDLAYDRRKEAQQLRKDYGIFGGAAVALGRDIGGAIGSTISGLYEGAKEGGQDISGVGSSQPGQPVSPAVLGTEMAFATPSPGMRAPTIPVPTGQPANALSVAPVATPEMVQGVQAQNAARSLIGQRYAQDLAGGGPVPADVTNQLAAGGAAGQPMTLADLNLPNVRALLGTTYREGGPARAFIKDFLETRDRLAPTRAEGAIAKHMGTGTVKQTQDALIAARSAEARPLWDKAMAGGSIAPLEKQFETALNATNKDLATAQRALVQAEQRITQAAARQSTADNVYATSGSNRARQFAEDQRREAQANLDRAQSVKDEAMSRLRQAQADGTANAPGAVWSPRLQMFLDDPIIQQGIKRGWRIERLNALEENRAFSPTDYAVVGLETNGDPIVGSVPNMRALAVAKEGLDAILDGKTMRTEFGTLTKMGRAVDGVRRQFIAELDRLNPDYKPARDAWSGKTSSLSALQYGKDIFNRKNLTEDIVQRAAEMTPNEKEFAKIGIAARMRENVMNVADAGDESKALANSRGNRERIRPFFRTEEDAGQFLDFVDRERAMFRTNYKILGGPETAERVADDMRRLDDDPRLNAALNAGEAFTYLAHGNVLGAARAALRGTNALARATPAVDPAVNLEVAKIILDSNLLQNQILRGGRSGADFLAQAQLPLVQSTLQRGMMNQLRRLPVAPPYNMRPMPVPPGLMYSAPPNYQAGQQ